MMTECVNNYSLFQGETRSSLQAAFAVPAHHQFMSNEVAASLPEVEGLKYTLDDNLDFFFDEFADGGGQRGCFHRRTFPWSSGASSPPEPPVKMSMTNEDGGGSWLLGFTSTTVDPLSASVPRLLRSNSGSSLDTYDSSSSTDPKQKKVLSFNEDVRVVPIPHSSEYSAMQKRKMYSNCQEVRANKIRNKKEFRYDGYDWRNVTEEWEMPVCALTGELVHPAHSPDF